jgi:hypothetical protein
MDYKDYSGYGKKYGYKKNCFKKNKAYVLYKKERKKIMKSEEKKRKLTYWTTAPMRSHMNI